MGDDSKISEPTKETTKLVLVSFEFLSDTVFSGNGVLSRSVVASLLLNHDELSEYQVFVVCASPKHQYCEIVNESLIVPTNQQEMIVPTLAIPVKKWNCLDWQSDFQLFSQNLKDFLSQNWNEKSKINKNMKNYPFYQNTFINFYQSSKFLLFVDFTCYFAAKTIMTLLSSKNEIKEKHNRKRRKSIEINVDYKDSIDTIETEIEASESSPIVKPIKYNETIKVVFLNFRVFHNNSNIMKDEYLKEKLFYEKWEFESINISNCIIANDCHECKILSKLFGQYRNNLTNFNEQSIDSTKIDQIMFAKFYQINDDCQNIYKFTTVHPPLRSTIEQLALTYWKQEFEICKFNNNNNNNNSETGKKENNNNNSVFLRGLKCQDFSKYFSNLVRKRRYLLCFSRISREKNVQIFGDLIEHLGCQWFKENGITPYIIGSTNDERYFNDIKDKIKKTKVKCKFSGYMQASELAQVLMDTKLNVHTAIREPFGMAICEASAFGVATIVNKKDIGAMELLTQDSLLLSTMTNGQQLANDIKNYLKKENHEKLVDTCKMAMQTSLGYGIEACGYVYKSILNQM